MSEPTAGELEDLYGRFCPDCGHIEISTDPELFVEWRECPECGGRES